MSRQASRISVVSTKSTPAQPIEVIPIFPKKLPELIVGPIYDECGFSLNERLALRQAWRVIKPFERRYGKEIHFNFLMKNYKAFENFRWNRKLDLTRLHGHSLAFMRFIGAVIEEKNPIVFQAKLTDNYNVHRRCHVHPDYMEMLMKSLISYVLDKLKYVSSSSLESGFQRLLDKFQAFYVNEETGGAYLTFQ